MKLDLLYEIDVPKPWPGPHPYGQREAEQLAYAEALEQIKLADRLGFHCTWHVEHHFREGRSHSPAPEVVIGALSQCTENIRLGFGVTLMPHAFTPPMRVAEKVATADVLSHGRVEWGTGRSTPMEQTAFGVPCEESRDQWEEAIRAVVQMWEDEYFEFHGKYLDFPRRMVTPKPFQDPHPPCWMAATSDGSAAVAGKLGLGLMSLSILQPVERLSQQIEQYRNAAADARTAHAGDHEQGCGVHARALRGLHGAVRGRRHLGRDVGGGTRTSPSSPSSGSSPTSPRRSGTGCSRCSRAVSTASFDPRDFNEADMIIVGDPEQCLDKMRKYAALGVDQLLCYVQFGHLGHESVMRTIELLGTEVIPTLEREGIEVSVQAKPS